MVEWDDGRIVCWSGGVGWWRGVVECDDGRMVCWSGGVGWWRGVVECDDGRMVCWSGGVGWWRGVVEWRALSRCNKLVVLFTMFLSLLVSGVIG